MGHSGGLPTMDRCGPAPPAAVKSPRAWLGATTPVQRERTSPAARLQPYHGLQALAGDPQAARPFPTARPSPLPGSNQPELELALRWGRTPFCERVSAGLLTAQHPALLPAASIDPLATGQRSSSGSMLCSPGGQWQRLAPGLPEQPKAQAERHGTAWQPSQGSGRSVPLLRAGQLSHQLLPSPFKAAQLRRWDSSAAVLTPARCRPAVLLARARETEASGVRSTGQPAGHGEDRRKASTSSKPQRPERAPTCFNTDVWAPDFASRVLRGTEVVVIVDKAIEG